MERKVCDFQTAKQLYRLCWITYMISCLGRFNYPAAMAELITAQGFTKAGAGLIGTALFAVYGLCQIVTGTLGDRVDPRKMIAVGLLGSSIINFAMGCASTQPVMLSLWIINGVFQSCMWSPVARIFAEMLPAESRRRAGSSAAATIPVSVMLIYLLAALSIRYFSWRLVFWIPSVLMLAAAFVWIPRMTMIYKRIETCGVVDVNTASKAEKRGSVVQIIFASGTLLIAVGALSHGLLKDGIQAWLPTFFTEQFHLTTYASTAVSIILPVFNILGVLVTRWLVARFIKNELAGAAAFFGVSFLSLGALAISGAHNSVVTLLTLTIASTAMIGANILVINLIPMHFGAIGRASTMTGILNCSAYAGSALSSFGVGAAVDQYGWGAAICIWIAFAAAACIAMLLGKKKWGRYVKDLA